MVNMGMRQFSMEPDHVKKLDNFRSLKRELNPVWNMLLFYLVDEFMSF